LMEVCTKTENNAQLDRRYYRVLAIEMSGNSH